MNEFLQIMVVILPFIIPLAAYFLVLAALFPNRAAKTQRVLTTMPGRSFGVGLINFLFFGLIALVLFSIAENAGSVVKTILMIPALVILAALAIALSFGLAGMVNQLGERIFPDHLVWKRTAWGTVVLSLACLLPAIGWFLLFPYAGAVGIGAFILGLFQRD